MVGCGDSDRCNLASDRAAGYACRKHVGIVQSLLVTCRLHDINPYDYFVDVLQRVGQHPASLVHQLTPQLWKQSFAANPLRSDLHKFGATGNIDVE
jgi:hypothetical protein